MGDTYANNEKINEHVHLRQIRMISFEDRMSIELKVRKGKEGKVYHSNKYVNVK